jgi:hypothetical protein
MNTTLTGIVDEHVTATNTFDLDAIMATFGPDALVNDNRREFRGNDEIRAWVAKEIVGDRVTIEPIEVFEQGGVTVLRGRYDGTFDRTGLPDELILTNYLTITDGLISAMIVIFNQAT